MIVFASLWVLMAFISLIVMLQADERPYTFTHGIIIFCILLLAWPIVVFGALAKWAEENWPMTTETRDLDCACAEAMGWTTKEFSSATALVRGKELVWQPPRYSTDPSTRAEMLRWLRACDFRLVEITGWDDGTWVAKGFGSPDHHLDREERGATIDEALARLVCAVAKAKKEQKP